VSLSLVERLLAREKARQRSYIILSNSYFKPENGTLKKLFDQENLVANVCPEASVYALKMEEEIKKMGNAELLKIDYSKLFIGPYKLFAPPYGSMYLEGKRKIMGDSTIDVRNMYREVGLDISVDFKEPPDHIAAELEFMHYLIAKEIEAIKSNDFKRARQYLQKQKKFLKNHLGVWVFEFTNKIEAQATTDFYKHLAKFTKIFIKKDRDEILNTSLKDLSNIVNCS
jgi:TorA maturation chaperone TorD